MNIKVKLLAAFLIFCAFLGGCGGDSVPLGQADQQWEEHTYPQIGLRLQLPRWNADIDDQQEMWLLLGYPLVPNPVADVQYRVTISADRLTDRQYRLAFRTPGTNPDDWVNSEHLVTSEKTNGFWIYSRRNLGVSNGFGYSVTARIKRLQDRKPAKLDQVGGNELKLAADVHRILDSIEVLTTNSMKTP